MASATKSVKHTLIERSQWRCTAVFVHQTSLCRTRIEEMDCKDESVSELVSKHARAMASTYKSPCTAPSVEMEEALKAGQAVEPCNEMQDAISRRVAIEHRRWSWWCCSNWVPNELVKPKSWC